jgi:DNA-binding response OmpR family regulator
MKLENEGSFKLVFSRDNLTGRFLKADHEPVLLAAARRFGCVFLTTSATDAATLNRHLSAAGIRAYHAGDTREAAILLAITRAKILLIDIDRTFDPWLETLQQFDEAYPEVPKIVLTARGPDTWSLILSRFALDIVPKPAHLGDLLGALECAHAIAQELNDPERMLQREVRVMSAIRSAAGGDTEMRKRESTYRARVPAARRSIQARLSAMMNKVTNVCWKFERHRTRKQHSHA